MAGSSGILFGMSLMQASEELGDGIDLRTAAAFTAVYTENVADRGDVTVGAKTMYEVLVPVTHVLRAAVEDDLSPVEASARALEAARRGVMYTTPLRANRGRASYTEWHSVGHPDPGAMGTYIVLQEVHRAVEGATDRTMEPTLGDGLD
jgi:dihydroxyacetone kinase-like protein